METTKEREIDRLMEVCRGRGIKIERSSLIDDGSVAYKHRLRTIFIGQYIEEKNIYCLLEKLKNLTDN